MDLKMKDEMFHEKELKREREEKRKRIAVSVRIRHCRFVYEFFLRA